MVLVINRTQFLHSCTSPAEHKVPKSTKPISMREVFVQLADDVKNNKLDKLSVGVRDAAASESITVTEHRVLRDAALLVLDCPTRSLLVDLHLTDIAVVLVEAFATDLNSTAQLVVGSASELDERVRSKLLHKLYTRGHLLAHLDARTSSEPWFNTLCDAFPSQVGLKQAAWDEVVAHFPEHDTTVRYKSAVRRVWLDAYPVRASLEKFSLPLQLADKLDMLGVKDTKDLEERHIEQVLQNENDKIVKAKLYDMWKTESASGREKSAMNEDTRVNGEKESASEAKERANEVKCRLITSTSNMGEKMTKKHDQALLGISSHGSDDLLRKAPNFDADGDFVEEKVGVRSMAVATIDGVSSWEIIRNASGGLASHGVAIAVNGTAIGLKRPPEKLLVIPRDCHFSEPATHLSHNSKKFESESASCNYRAIVESGGTTLATSLGITGWGGHLEAQGSMVNQSTDKSTHREQWRASYMMRITESVLPVKSFRLSKSDVVLSPNAIDDLKEIYNPHEARRFMERYGSHIPCGNQHLGGVRWEIIEVNFVEDVEESVLEQALTQERCISSGLGGSSASGVAGTSGAQHDFNASEAVGERKKIFNHEYSSNRKVECTGKNVTSFASFQESLLDQGSWALIDRGGFDSMVPVWDFLTGESLGDKPTAMRVAEMLRVAWLEDAEQFNQIPGFEDLITRASTKKLEDARRAIEQQLKKLSDFKIESVGERDLLDSVRELYAQIDEFDCSFRGFLVADLLRGDDFQRLLRRLVHYSDSPRVQSTLQYLSNRFDSRLLERLSQQVPRVLLDESVTSTLKSVVYRSQKNEIQWAPRIADALCNIPAEIRAIIAEVDDLAMAINDNVLTQRVGDFLSANLRHHALSSREGDQVEPIENMLANWDFTAKTGFQSTLSTKTAKLLALNIERLLSGEVTNKGDPFQDILDRWRRNFVLPHTSEVEPKSLNFVQMCRRFVTSDSADLILHTLVHRLDIEGSLYSVVDQCFSDSDAWGDSEEEKEEEEEDCGKPQAPSMYDALIRVQETLNVAARSVVARLLLERRFLVPFVGEGKPKIGEERLGYDVQPFTLVDTFVGRDYPHASLSTDTSHLRVVIMSTKSKKSSTAMNWVQELFHVRSFFAMDRQNETELTAELTGAELGWGFYKGERADTAGKNFVPVMLLHIIGEFHPLRSFISLFADVVFVELADEAEPLDLQLHHGRIVEWVKSDRDTIRKKKTGSRMVTCSAERVVARLTKQLHRYASTPETWNYQRLQILDLLTRTHDLVPRCDHLNSSLQSELKLMVESLDFSSVFTLEMQREFARYSSERIKLQREADSLISTNRHRDLLPGLRYEHELIQQAKLLQSANHPLIAHFIRLLSLPSVSQRVASLMHLERLLAAKFLPLTTVATQNEQRTWDNMQNDKSPQNEEAWRKCVEETNKVSFSLTHLWREVSHLFVANISNATLLPTLAARHLLDGFTLELMDGDAGAINMPWIQGVLQALSAELGSARVFVLSIMGVQSSGKSTLLNVMFGVRFRTSVGRCTRGVNLQLIKCTASTSEYDYVLLMDTEGLRAGELNGTDDSVWRDNRMATLAILPADASIILTKGEATNHMNEILPIVLTAYQRSELAQERNGLLLSKLFFVFNQVNANESVNLQPIIQTLRNELNKSAAQVARIQGGDHIESDDAPAKTASIQMSTVFRDVRLDMAKPDESDARVLGSMAGDVSPPHDHPKAQFGTDVLKLREYIHARVVGDSTWRPRTTAEFGSYFALVNECIEHADFDFSFVAAIDRINFDNLAHKIEQCIYQLTSSYSNVFETISQLISARADQGSSAGPKTTSQLVEEVDSVANEFCGTLKDMLSSQLEQLDSNVKSILRDRRYKKWEANFASPRWRRHKLEQVAHWDRMVKAHVDLKFQYNRYVNQYKCDFRTRVANELGGGKYNHYNSSGHDELFESIFDDVVENAQREHRPLSPQVPSLVNEEFVRNRSVKQWMNRAIGAPEDQSTVATRIYNYVKHKLGDTSDDKLLLKRIQEQVDGHVSTAKKYSHDIVNTCVKLIEEALHTSNLKHVERGRFCHRLQFNLGCDLKKIQDAWDQKNNVAARFQASREEMREYFDLVAKGCKGMEAFQEVVVGWLVRGLSTAFEGELARSIGKDLKSVRWVREHTVLQALVDADLVKKIHSGDVIWAIELLQRPKQHRDSVIQGELVKRIEAAATKQLNVFIGDCEAAIHNAAKETAKEPSERSGKFAEHLRNNMRKQLLSDPSSRFIDGLPDTSEEQFALDDQPIDIFYINDAEYVCRPMVQAVVNQAKMITASMKQRMWYERVGRQAVEYVHDASHGADSGVLPRCGEPCPHCKSPCIRELGHVAKCDEARHDAIHQPVGLAGICYSTNQKLSKREYELGEYSCSASREAGMRFWLSDTLHRYEDFEKVYPAWSLPVSTEALKLREYIFFRYQDELVQTFSESGVECKRCTEIPPTYNHSLADIMTVHRSFLQ